MKEDKNFSRRALLKGAGIGVAYLSLENLFDAVFAKKATAATKDLKKVKFALAWLPQGGYAMMIAAKQLGLWEKRGLDVTVDRGFGSGRTAQSVGLGEYPYGIADFAVAVQHIDKGLDLIDFAMVAPITAACIGVLEESNIKVPKDLEGKTIGATPGSGEHQLWPAYAKAAGIDSNKIKFSYMEASLPIPALIEKKVDAIGTYYDTLSPQLWARDIKHRIFLYADAGLKLYSVGMITTSKRFKEEKDVVNGLAEGAMEALKMMYLEPEKVLDAHMKAVVDYEGAERNRAAVKHGMAIRTTQGLVPYVKEKGLGWHDPEYVRETVNIIGTYMGLKTKIDPEKAYTNEFVGNVKLTASEWKKVEENVKDYIVPKPEVKK